jgi:nucleoside-diphosphate-sugar epimerase
METCLVTGGYGGLGSNICVDLARRGHDVITVGISDDPPTNIERLPSDQRERIRRRTCDLRDRERLGRIVRDEDVDGIVHSGALMPGTSKEMRAHFEVNGGGTLNLLEAARECAIDRFVYVGSGSVYENRPPEGEPYTEDECPIPTLDRPYSIVKYVGEMLCEYYRRTLGLETVIVRVSRLWGEPGVRTGDRAYPMDRIITDLLAGEDVFRDAGGDHPNDYTHNADAAAGIVRALLTPIDSLQQRVYNVSRGKHVTVDEIARVCAAAFDATVEFGPGHWDDLAQSIRPPFDISAARRDLGYEPVPFEDRLREYIDYRKKLAGVS